MSASASIARKSGVSSNSATIILFSLAIFTSAFLLFSVQPMFTRMVLPILGGSPSVWSVAMVFFQTLLLLGYAYAHWLTRKLRPRWAVLVHLVFMAAAFLAMPIAVSEAWGKPPAEPSASWLLILFAVSVGAPAEDEP